MSVAVGCCSQKCGQEQQVADALFPPHAPSHIVAVMAPPPDQPNRPPKKAQKAKDREYRRVRAGKLRAAEKEAKAAEKKQQG